MNELRHIEEHRQWIINLIVIVVSGAVAISGSIGFSIALVPISVLVFLLGVLGIFATLKLYERQIWYQSRLKLLINKIDIIHKELKLSELYSTHESMHKRRHVRHSWDESIRARFSSVRMHIIWIIFNVFVCLLGITIFILSLVL
jgi:hypothetical protein